MNQWNDKWNYVIYDNKEEAIEFAANHLIKTAQKAIHQRGAFYLALSGGSTPKAVYQKLYEKKDLIDWSYVWLFWSDERCVLPDSDESNFKMAVDQGMLDLGVPPKNIFRLQGETAPKKAAAEYEEQILRIVPDACFDLILLGMGEDGHTASLFPGTAALKEKEHLVVSNYVEKLDAWRLTFTFPLLKKAREVNLYVLGEGKAPVVEKIFNTKSTYPVAKVGTKKHPALWIFDRASAKSLPTRVTDQSR